MPPPPVPRPPLFVRASEAGRRQLHRLGRKKAAALAAAAVLALLCLLFLSLASLGIILDNPPRVELLDPFGPGDRFRRTGINPWNR